MKAEVKQITVTINENEALSILNALRVGIYEEKWCDDPDKKAATDLHDLLNGNFFSAKKNVHFTN
jgi:hypothetical protein